MQSVEQQTNIVLSTNVNKYEAMNLQEAETALIFAALKACDGDTTKAAQKLNIARASIYNKLKRQGLSVKDWKNS